MRSTSRTGSSASRTTTWAWTGSTCGRPTGSARAATRCATSSSPTGEADIANGKAVPGRGQLYIDGRLVANTEYPHTTPLPFELEGLSCGFDFGAPAADGYEPPFTFTGTIHQVSVDLTGELIEDDEGAMRLLMAQQ